MPDYLDKLIADARNRINSDYYDITEEIKHTHIGFSQAIKSAQHNAIIAEIKPKSPSRGTLRTNFAPNTIATQLQRGGATALSILTEPTNFGGTINAFTQVRQHVNLPLLMKDIIIDSKQVTAAEKMGADCILIILAAVIRRGLSLTNLARKAHDSQLEVLLEVHNKAELKQALREPVDIVGVNNRNLTDLTVDLNTTRRLLSEGNFDGKTILTESGIETADDIRSLKHLPVKGFLIGSSIMLSDDVEKKVRDFVLA